MVIDHLCRNPPCVNAEHLEQVTNRENALRGVGPSAIRAQMTHCINGHLLEPGNLVTYQWRVYGRRRCLTCERAWQREYRDARRDAS
jgi:hypothetical protein